MESRQDRTGQNNILLSCPILPRLHARSRLYEFGVLGQMLFFGKHSFYLGQTRFTWAEVCLSVRSFSELRS